MRVTLFLPALILAVAFAAYPQGNHWTETPEETIWRERYGNCDHRYFVKLPPGVIGHDSSSLSPNHGILISAKDPGVTTELTLQEPRLVEVYHSGAGKLESPQAYVKLYALEQEMRPGRFAILERRDIKFRGSTAEYIHFRKETEHSLTSEGEMLVVHRAPKGIGPSFYVVMLRTTPEFYSRDHALYLQIRDGLRFVRVPLGKCSND